MLEVEASGDVDCIAMVDDCCLDFRGFCACCNFLGRDTPRGDSVCTISRELGS